VEADHPLQTTIRFGVFEVDLRAGELRKQGVRVKLQEQPLQVLLVLLENPGAVVTREELQQRIWPSDTFVDFDHGLYNAIRRLREALEDSAETPHYVETLARRGYRFIGRLDPAPTSTPSSIRSLAVLPLENLSHDPEQEYFAEGMTEALITTLAKIGEIRVVSRTSIMMYKGVRKPLREIARELEVDAIIEGTVLRAGDRVRITAQLIDTSKETHLWSESYDRDLRDVLALQAEVAQSIAREIRIKITSVDQARIGEVHPVEPDAYEAYLRGRYHWNRRSAEGLGKALQYFQQAIACDETYAAAYSGLADCLSNLSWLSIFSPEDGCAKAKELAAQALEMNPSLAESHASVAWATLIYDHDFRAAEREFERSIELNPRYAHAHHWLGLYLGLTGHYEEGYTELKRAIRLEPHSIMNQTLGFVLVFNRRYDQAKEQFEKALELDPNSFQAYWGLGAADLYKSQHQSAIAAMEKAVQLSGRAPLFLATLGEAYAAAGYSQEAQKILDQLRDVAKERYVTPYGLAHIHAALGKKEDALHWLETAYQEHAVHMMCLKTDPRFDDLRPDPRFQNLLRRMDFPQ
jgi:TolB-like protein/Tfp pilus assembly protein PilF